MKVIVLSWWATETRMNSNWKDVVRKKVAPHVYKKKPTQYFMETQLFFIILTFSFFLLYHLLFHCSLFLCVLRVFFSPILVTGFLHFLNFGSYCYALNFERLVFLSPIILGFVQVSYIATFTCFATT